MGIRLGFIVILSPFVLFSQYQRTFFIESGSSANISFNSPETSLGPLSTGLPGYAGYYVLKQSRGNTYSFYSRLGIECPFATKKHFSLSFPFILGYREQKEIYTSEQDNFYWTGTVSRSISTTMNSSKMMSLIFGPKLNFRFKKISWYTSVYVNSDLSFFYMTKTGQYTSYERNINPGGSASNSDVTFNLSLQNGLVYHINPKIGIGLACDVFFYAVDPTVFHGHPANSHLFNMGYGKNSSIINNGLRLQYSF
jgi:hypothetical protein